MYIGEYIMYSLHSIDAYHILNALVTQSSLHQSMLDLATHRESNIYVGIRVFIIIYKNCSFDTVVNQNSH